MKQSTLATMAGQSVGRFARAAAQTGDAAAALQVNLVMVSTVASQTNHNLLFVT